MASNPGSVRAQAAAGQALPDDRTLTVAIARTVGDVEGVEAVQPDLSIAGYVRVYVAVAELTRDLSHRINDAECELHEKFPEVAFELHVRAHQGRVSAHDLVRAEAI